MSASPVPTIKKEEYEDEVDFFEAMKAVVDGKRVTKAEWEDIHQCVYLADEYLKIHIDNKVSNFTVRLPDMLGEDWIVL
jgi:hypothetical protein